MQSTDSTPVLFKALKWLMLVPFSAEYHRLRRWQVDTTQRRQSGAAAAGPPTLLQEADKGPARPKGLIAAAAVDVTAGCELRA